MEDNEVKFILEKQVVAPKQRGDPREGSRVDARFEPIPGEEYPTAELAHQARTKYVQKHGGLVVVTYYPPPEAQAI